jgi:hypothetical protein
MLEDVYKYPISRVNCFIFKVGGVEDGYGKSVLFTFSPSSPINVNKPNAEGNRHLAFIIISYSGFRLIRLNISYH